MEEVAVLQGWISSEINRFNQNMVPYSKLIQSKWMNREKKKALFFSLLLR